MDELSVVCLVQQPDIIGVTESWAHAGIDDAELTIHGYDLFRRDRPSRSRGGGVLLYVKEDLGAVAGNQDSQFPEYVECCIRNQQGKWVRVGVIYRTPNPDIFTFDLHLVLRQHIDSLHDARMVLMGDFNYGDIDWSLGMSEDGAPYETQAFLDCIDNNYWIQHVHDATRHDKILDLVFTLEPDLVENVTTVGPLGDSDHRMLTFAINWSSADDVVHNRVDRYDYGKMEVDKMKQDFRQIEWRDILTGTIHDCWSTFKGILLDAECKYTPKYKNRSAVKKKIWMTHKSIRLIKRKHKAYQRYKDSSHPACMRLNKLAKKELRKARQHFERKLVENIKVDVKSFFAYANGNSNIRVKPGPLVDDAGICAATDMEMVEEFNRFFASVFTQERPEEIKISAQSVPYDGPILTDFDITTDMVAKVLDSIRPDKSIGADDINPRLLIAMKEELLEPVTLLFNKSLTEGKVPGDWKDAYVTPIFKKGTKNRVENYRPVSLTSQLCKLMEKIIRDKILEHMETADLIRNTQHGFRKHRSCLSNLLMFVEKITSWVAEGNNVDVVYLDFARAFDKVPHRKLLKKLASYGIGGKLLDWISDWLYKRRQKVCIKGTQSTWRDVVSGVPQGSVLGPLLFVLFINDLDDGIDNWILKFADDTKLFGIVNSLRDQTGLQTDLDRLTEWESNWDMKFNITKCKRMHIGKYNGKIPYSMNGITLAETTVERDLGILISADLKVSAQCQQAYSKAQRVLGMINRCILSRSREMLVPLYKSLVRPHVEYVTPVWSPHYAKDKALIEKVQHRFTRMIVGMKGLGYDDRLRALNLWTLEERRNRFDLIEVYKILRLDASSPMRDFFDLDQTGRTRGHTYKLRKHGFNTDIQKFCFSNRVISRWNKLPADVVMATSLHSFKSGLNQLRSTRMGFFMDNIVS